MRSEPHVDAVDVEVVRAEREGSETIAVLELEQADGAVTRDD